MSSSRTRTTSTACRSTRSTACTARPATSRTRRRTSCGSRPKAVVVPTIRTCNQTGEYENDRNRRCRANGQWYCLGCATAGLKVILNDLDERAVKRGIDSISANLAQMISKGKTASDEAQRALVRITGDTTLTELVECDFVIEVATENVQIKEELLRKLDAIVRPGTVIATN